TGFSTSSSRHPQLRAQTPLRSGRKRDRGNGEGDREAARPPPPPSILAPPPFSYPLGILSILVALPSLRKVRVSLVLSFLAMLDLGLSVADLRFALPAIAQSTRGVLASVTMWLSWHSACRTAICKSKRGGFKDTHPEDLLAPVLKV
ncbi:hypothetical protein B296_00040874, partial [Ensete ventricosum]